jgi:hypothetical protein
MKSKTTNVIFQRGGGTAEIVKGPDDALLLRLTDLDCYESGDYRPDQMVPYHWPERIRTWAKHGRCDEYAAAALALRFSQWDMISDEGRKACGLFAAQIPGVSNPFKRQGLQELDDALCSGLAPLSEEAGSMTANDFARTHNTIVIAAANSTYLQVMVNGTLYFWDTKTGGYDGWESCWLDPS